MLNKLLMLDCPQSMQPVKDTLIYIYHSEIGQAQLQSQIRELQRELQSQIRELHPETLWRGGSIQELVYLEVTWDNLDHWRQKAQHGHFFYSRMVKSIWFSLQESRRDIYVRWAEILQEHGIDPRDFR
ncbi:MAG: hypothetical protein DDT30_00842 [Dehalococcoidia bacterium]|nr:hypothetical protein [Bacillota bacterium]